MSSNLSFKFGQIQGLTLFPEDRGTVTITATNQGNELVNGPITFSLFASTDSNLDRTPLNVRENKFGFRNERLEGKDELLGTVTSEAFNLSPGESTTLTFDFARLKNLRTPSVVSPGAYYLIGEIDSNNIAVESNEKDNISTAFVSTDGTDVVLDWNSTALNAIQFVANRPFTSPPYAARNLAIVHGAIYDAVNSFDKSYKPYLVNADAPEGASIEAAVVGAAYQALTTLYSPEQFLLQQGSRQTSPELSIETDINARVQANPNTAAQPSQASLLEIREKLQKVRTTFEEQRTRSLEEIADDPEAELAGFNFGVNIANQILQARQDDGALKAAMNDIMSDGSSFKPRRDPGSWRPTPPDFVKPLLPDWGNVKTFGPRTVEQIRQEAKIFGPPAFDSPDYQRDINEVRRLGEKNSTARTREQTEIALFWAYDRPDTFRPNAQWNQIAQEVTLQEGKTLVDNARLFANLNFAQADAGITAWDTKFKFQQLRPITAIRQAGDLDWTPLLDTPPFPDYISGHAIFGGAAAGVLRDFFDKDISFDVVSQELPGVSRSYEPVYNKKDNMVMDSFTLAANENALSRVYGGVHVRSSQVTDFDRNLQRMAENVVLNQSVEDMTVAEAAQIADVTNQGVDLVVDKGVAAGLALGDAISDNLLPAI